jgi:hypothetical protein
MACDAQGFSLRLSAVSGKIRWSGMQQLQQVVGFAQRASHRA